MFAATISESLRAGFMPIIEPFMKSLDEVELLDSSGINHHDFGIAALVSFQQSISSLIVKMKCRRNLVLPIHQLPEEIFLQILRLATDFNDDGWSHGIHKIAQVSIHWRNVVVRSPCFWRVVRDDMDDRKRATILRLNPNGPLVVWTKRPPAQASVGETFLEIMHPAAHRWRILIVERSYSDKLFKGLQNLPPTLKDLCIVIRDAKQTRQFSLIEGHPLRYLELQSVSTQWDSSRLRNLRALSLKQLDANLPTLGQIVSILSSSPQLWWLVLSSWTVNDSPEYAEDLEHYAHTIVTLPFLSSLILLDIPPVVATFLTNNVRTTTLSCLVANSLKSIDEVDLTHTDSTLFDMVKQVLQRPCITNTTISYDGWKDRIYILSMPLPVLQHGLIYQHKDIPGMNIMIPTKLFGSTWQILLDILAANAPCVSFEITGQVPENRQLPHRVLLALLPHLPHIKRMKFRYTVRAGTVLRCLTAPISSVDEGMRWLCPRLDTMTMRYGFYDNTLVEDVVEFLQQRYLGRTAGKEQPLAASNNPANREEDRNDLGANEDSCVADVSSFEISRYPTLLKKLLLPKGVLDEVLQRVQDAQCLQGILARSD